MEHPTDHLKVVATDPMCRRGNPVQREDDRPALTRPAETATSRRAEQKRRSSILRGSQQPGSRRQRILLQCRAAECEHA
jgi:hypothetical protein